MVTKTDTLLSVAEAAKLCDLSEPAIRARILDGRLAAVRIGRNIYIEADRFEQFLAARQPDAAR